MLNSLQGHSATVPQFMFLLVSSVYPNCFLQTIVCVCELVREIIMRGKCWRGLGFTDLSPCLRGFSRNCTVGSHLLAHNLSRSSNLDSRREQMNSSVFCYLWVFI